MSDALAASLQMGGGRREGDTWQTLPSLPSLPPCPRPPATPTHTLPPSTLPTHFRAAGVTTAEGVLLLNTAHVLRALRAAMKHNDLPGMVSALERARDCELSAVVQDELAAVLREFDERAVVSDVLGALAHGGLALRSPQDGEGGVVEGSTPPSDTDLDLHAIATAGLEDALRFAHETGFRSRRAAGVVESAQLVLRLRHGASASALACVHALCCAHPER